MCRILHMLRFYICYGTSVSSDIHPVLPQWCTDRHPILMAGAHAVKAATVSRYDSWILSSPHIPGVSRVSLPFKIQIKLIQCYSVCGHSQPVLFSLGFCGEWKWRLTQFSYSPQLQAPMSYWPPCPGVDPPPPHIINNSYEHKTFETLLRV